MNLAQLIQRKITKNSQKPSKSENDKVSVDDSLNGSEWFRLVPRVETASTVPTVGNDAVESKESQDWFCFI